MSDKIRRVNENIRDRLGKCYKLTYQFVVRNRDWELVQGYIKDTKIGKTGRVVNHAWAEKEDEVYDPVMNMETDRMAYYYLFDAEPVERFTARAANQEALRTGHYGPWHEIPPGKV